MFNYAGNKQAIFLKQNVSSVRECATVSANTDGGVYWTYRTRNTATNACTCNCVVKNSAAGNGFSGAGRISGGRECGEMSQENWDQMIFESCERKYNRGISGNSAATSVDNVENEQACAELAVSKPSASFWEFRKGNGYCSFKKSYPNDAEKEYRGGSGKVIGNVGCGLMSQERWALLTNCTLEYDIGSYEKSHQKSNC